MRVALFATYRVSKKEPLAELVQRIHQAFLDSGLREHRVSFSFADAPVPGFTSAVDRALKRFPQLQQFRCSHALMPGSGEVAQISNCPGRPAEGQQLDVSTLLAIAQGIPRSLPFHNVMIHFHHPEFGEALPMTPISPLRASGITAGDSWWVNGRNRSLVSLHLVESSENSKNLPEPSQPVAAILGTFGKPKEITQLPMPSLATATTAAQAAQADAKISGSVAEVVREYRSRLHQILEQARLPHDLASAMEALRITPVGTSSGPKKPALVAAFKPIGYDCRGDSGVFTLSRKSPNNLAIEITLDVGTWSNSLLGFYKIHGVGFTARLPLPPSLNAIDAGQYQIGDAANWSRIVENLAALVTEYDRSFLPAVESAAGPAPAWFKPRS